MLKPNACARFFQMESGGPSPVSKKQFCGFASFPARRRPPFSSSRYSMRFVMPSSESKIFIAGKASRRNSLSRYKKCVHPSTRTSAPSARKRLMYFFTRSFFSFLPASSKRCSINSTSSGAAIPKISQRLASADSSCGCLR